MIHCVWLRRWLRPVFDLMELQIPFSEPMADGPVILKANADALSAGARVDRSFELAGENYRPL